MRDLLLLGSAIAAAGLLFGGLVLFVAWQRALATAASINADLADAQDKIRTLEALLTATKAAGGLHD